MTRRKTRRAKRKKGDRKEANRSRRCLPAGRFPAPAGNDSEGKETKQMKVEQIAEVCHEVNRAYCAVIGDKSQLPWAKAPEWQRTSVIKGVRFHLANPDAGPSHGHDEWLKEKRATGWRYGSVKSAEKKEHPCCVPYEELPVEEKAKGELFIGVVRALRHLID